MGSRNYLDGILRQFEFFCEQPLKFAICCAFDWRCSDSNSQRAIVFTCDFAPRGTRHNHHSELKRAALL
jgi:hypothetical protein